MELEIQVAAKQGFRVGHFVFTLIAGVMLPIPLTAQTDPTAKIPTPLERLMSPKVPRLRGKMAVYYSPSAKPQANRDRAEIGACVAWWKQRLHATTTITIGVLNETDWNRVGGLETYPMAEAFPRNGV